MRLSLVAVAVCCFRCPLGLGAKADSLDDLLRSSALAIYALTHPQVMQLKDYGDAWNTGNVEGIVGHFSDSGFLYTDALSQQGIQNKAELRTYLRRVFAKYPSRTGLKTFRFIKVHWWQANGQSIIVLHFIRAETLLSLQSLEREMERYAFDGYNQLTRDEIHLIFDQVNLGPALGVAPISRPQ